MTTQGITSKESDALGVAAVAADDAATLMLKARAAFGTEFHAAGHHRLHALGRNRGGGSVLPAGGLRPLAQGDLLAVDLFDRLGDGVGAGGCLLYTSNNDYLAAVADRFRPV